MTHPDEYRLAYADDADNVRATASSALRDSSAEPHATPCRDCQQVHLQGNHIAMTAVGGRVVWEGCSDCWVRRTDPSAIDLPQTNVPTMPADGPAYTTA